MLWLDVAQEVDWGSNLCGSGFYNDMGKITMRAKILHSSPTITLKFVHSLPSGSGSMSWGIRDLSLVTNMNSGSEVNEVCGYAHTETLWTKVCDCPDG